MDNKKIYEIMDRFLSDFFYTQLEEQYDIKEMDIVKKEICKEFRKIADKLNTMDIENNNFTENMIEAGIYLAMYKTLKNRKFELKDIAAILHNTYTNNIETTPRRISELEKKGSCAFTEEFINKMRLSCKETRKNPHLHCYIVDFVEGDGTFNYGNNTYQCPVHILSNLCDCGEFTNSICDIDFINSNYLHTGLTRKECLATGDEYCGFRWRKPSNPEQ